MSIGKHAPKGACFLCQEFFLRYAIVWFFCYEKYVTVRIFVHPGVLKYDHDNLMNHFATGEKEGTVLENTIGYPDKPLETSGEDLFDVGVYVNALCSFIRGCETPMTISIQGDWGSGKTSMMNMMKANMQADVWPIWFNTWQFSQFDMGNGLAFSMMDVLLKGLGCDQDYRNKVLKGIIGFGKKAIKAATDTAMGSGAADFVGELMEGDSSVDFAAEIMELKNKFQKAVDQKLEKEVKNRVVVFVDDLDRLQPSKAVELLEVLKLFLDCKKCVFVLAVDYEVVTLGINQKFGGEVSEEKGRSFFDKIIQLPFKMPVANYDIHKYVSGMMKRMNISTDEKEVALFYNLIETSVGFNPRSMKRLFNTYELLDIVTESTVKNIEGSIRRRVLFAIICTQMCFEKLYGYLTSTHIDENTFVELQKDETVERALKEIYDIEPDGKTTPEIERIRSFIPFFISALQIDDDYTLSDEEVSNFKAIIKSSVVTSVGASAESSEDESRDWEFRYKNKDIAKETAEKLSSIGTFAIWQPRKERDGIKFSDVSGYYSFDTKAGFSCTLEYYLSKINDSEIGVGIYAGLNEGKGLENAFFEALGSNPLKMNVVPQKMDWGKYLYNSVLRFNCNDSAAADQIATLTRAAYKSLNETIDAYVASKA